MPNDDPVSDAHIFRAWARGLSEETLAETYGLELAQVKRIVHAEKDKRGNLRDLDPLEFFRDNALRTESLIEELATLAAKEKGLIRVRAVESRFMAMKHLFEIYQAAGVLPRDLGLLRVHIDAKTLSERFMRVLDEWNPPDEILDAMEKALDPTWSGDE